jgi:UDP-N-acetylmuramoyl-tripeptide--D-alanyl-D-alanine ligase
MIGRIYKHYLELRSISTDTRKIEAGSLFFALKGPNFNANKLAAEALKKGARLCIVDDPDYANDERCILVEDVLESLQALAKHHRAQLTIPVIGLTGSNGKTTTKELITTALSAKYNVVATSGNLNNHIGVPLTILSILPKHEIAVIEMGANHVGEIEFLCSISNPTHGLITNIGKAHLEGFGGIEGVIRGKSELYQHLIKKDSVVWINSSNPILSNMAKRFKAPLFYPAKGDYYHAELISASPEILLKADNGDEILMHLVGAYNFENIVVALCIAKYFEVPAKDANKAVADYQPSNNRSQVIVKGTKTIILDAYNANPTSMASAIDNLDKITATKKIAILGDMKELGPEGHREHKLLGQLLQEKSFDQVFLCGELIKPALDQIKNAHYYKNRNELLEGLKNANLENATILIKASRSIGLEAVLEVI